MSAAAAVLVTGATGSVGSNVCALAAARGMEVRALVRPDTDATKLAAGGARIVPGDVTDLESLIAAADGVDAIVHSAAVVGGTWSTATPQDFETVNRGGTVNVLDAAQRLGVGKVVALSTAVVCDQDVTITERSPIAEMDPHNSPYTRSKLAAYYAGMARAATGLDVMFIVPGGIYGPTPIPERALVPTIFTGTLLAAARGEISRYLPMPLPWALTTDVAEVTLAALERGRGGHRYLALGRPDDTCSLPALCNRFLELAGIEHRVAEFDVNAPGASTDAEFGSMVAYVKASYPVPSHDASQTARELGVTPTSLDDGLAQTLAWLRSLGEL